MRPSVTLYGGWLYVRLVALSVRRAVNEACCQRGECQVVTKWLVYGGSGSRGRWNWAATRAFVSSA